MSLDKNELDEIVNILTRQNTFEYPMESLKIGYLGTLEQRLNEYLERIKELPENSLTLEIKNNMKVLEALNSEIIQIIKAYLSGEIEKSYNLFGALIGSRRSEVESLVMDIDSESEELYRVRWSEKDLHSKEDLFHIPFDKRHLVSTMRYSIAGVPCLYFGNTIYACWLEMDKPDLNKLYISKFKNAIDIKVLDFAITFETLKKIPTIFDQYPIDYSVKKIKSFLSLYPLILACSFKKKDENSRFNIEYILPNMLLQWISNEKEHIAGIRYFSTKMKHERYNSIGINTVFPPKENKDSIEGFCPKLKRTFKFTAPVSWSMINTLPLEYTKEQYRQEISEREKILQSMDEVIDSHYRMTKFYQIERNIDYYFEFLTLDDKQRPKNINTIDDWYFEESFDKDSIPNATNVQSI